MSQYRGEARESAVGRLLRQAGVEPRARRHERDKLGLREAEQKTGVSRQTLSVWLRPLAPGERRKYDARTLDLVSEGLGISRRALGIAAMQDAGQVLIGSDTETLEAIYDYLAQRDPGEQAQILAWLAQRIAERRSGGGGSESGGESGGDEPRGAADRSPPTARRDPGPLGAAGS